MLTIPEHIKELYRRDNNSDETKKKIKLVFFDNVVGLYPDTVLFPSEDLFPEENQNVLITIENNKIDSESLKITETLSSETDLKFGACEGTTFEVTIADVAMDLSDKEFMMTVEVGGYEILMGIFRVTSYERQSNRRKRKITANDRMVLFNRDVAAWYNGLKFPMTLFEFRNSLCDYLGVEQLYTNLVFDDMEVTKTLDPAQLSGLEVMQSICEINGCFGHFDHTGLFAYVTLPQTGLFPSETLYPQDEVFPSESGGDNRTWETISHYKQPCTYEDYLIDGIDGVTIRDEEGSIDVSYGVGDNSYQILANFLVYDKTREEREQIAKKLLEIIGFRTYRPANVTTPCLPWVEVGDGIQFATRDDYIETLVLQRTITGIQAMMDNYVSTGNKKRSTKIDIKSEIKQLGGKTAKITKELDRVSVELNDFQTDTTAKLEVMNDEISAKVSRENLISEINVSPEQIVLRSNRLIVESTNFKLDGNGNATFSGVINGGSINIADKFKVDKNGNLTATSGKFTGDITGATFNGTGTLKGTNLNCTWVSANLITVHNDNIRLDAEGHGDFAGTVTAPSFTATDDIYMDSLANRWGNQWRSLDYNMVRIWEEIDDLQQRVNWLENNMQ